LKSQKGGGRDGEEVISTKGEREKKGKEETSHPIREIETLRNGKQPDRDK